MSVKQTDIFNQLSASFVPATVLKWEQMISTWNANAKAPNPYAEPKGGKLPLMLFIFNVLILSQRLLFKMFD